MNFNFKSLSDLNAKDENDYDGLRTYAALMQMQQR